VTIPLGLIIAAALINIEPKAWRIQIGAVAGFLALCAAMSLS